METRYVTHWCVAYNRLKHVQDGAMTTSQVKYIKVKYEVQCTYIARSYGLNSQEALQNGTC